MPDLGGGTTSGGWDLGGGSAPGGWDLGVATTGECVEPMEVPAEPTWLTKPSVPPLAPLIAFDRRNSASCTRGGPQSSGLLGLAEAARTSRVHCEADGVETEWLLDDLDDAIAYVAVAPPEAWPRVIETMAREMGPLLDPQSRLELEQWASSEPKTVTPIQVGGISITAQVIDGTTTRWGATALRAEIEPQGDWDVCTLTGGCVYDSWCFGLDRPCGCVFDCPNAGIIDCDFIAILCSPVLILTPLADCGEDCDDYCPDGWRREWL